MIRSHRDQPRIEHMITRVLASGPCGKRYVYAAMVKSQLLCH